MALDLGIFLEGAQSTFKVKVSDNDAQAQYLLDKFISSDGSVTITETNDGGIETIDLTASGSVPVTKKGDIFTHDASGVAAIAVGTDGQALIADSTTATGLKWDTISANSIYTADDSLTDNRTVDVNGFVLNFEGAQSRWRYDANGYLRSFKVSDGVEEFSYLPIGGGYATFGRSTGARVRIKHSDGGIYGYSNATNINYRIHSVFDNWICGDANDLGIGIKTNPLAKVHIHSNGSTSATTALLVENSSSTEAFKILDDLAIIMANLPTSSVGLATGQLWNNSGVINIV